jgi:hypothetical protein
MKYTGWCQNDFNAQGYTCPPSVSVSRCACSPAWKACRLVRPSHGPQSHSDAGRAGAGRASRRGAGAGALPHRRALLLRAGTAGLWATGKSAQPRRGAGPGRGGPLLGAGIAGLRMLRQRQAAPCTHRRVSPGPFGGAVAGSARPRD